MVELLSKTENALFHLVTLISCDVTIANGGKAEFRVSIKTRLVTLINMMQLSVSIIVFSKRLLSVIQ
jgi:hypothetical protein